VVGDTVPPTVSATQVWESVQLKVIEQERWTEHPALSASVVGDHPSTCRSPDRRASRPSGLQAALQAVAWSLATIESARTLATKVDGAAWGMRVRCRHRADGSRT